MKSRIRIGGIAAGATLTVALVAAPAQAVLVVNSATPPSQFGPISKAFLSNGSATNLVQKFTLPTATQLSKVAFYGAGTDVDLAIADAVGPGAVDAINVRWSTEGNSFTGGRAWREFNLPNLTLAAGTYYVIMTSDDASGGIWAKVSQPNALNVNVNEFGNAVYAPGPKRMTDLQYTFDSSGTQVLATRLEGTPIPTPGALALAGLAGLGAARRRR